MLPPRQIFEKALDEPKYSSLYAQLCRRLHDDAPNFDPPAGSGVNGAAAAAANSSFSRLLLNKCKDEFENRYKATNEFELKRAANNGKPLTDDEEEQVSVGDGSRQTRYCRSSNHVITTMVSYIYALAPYPLIGAHRQVENAGEHQVHRGIGQAQHAPRANLASVRQAAVGEEERSAAGLRRRCRLDTGRRQEEGRRQSC